MSNGTELSKANSANILQHTNSCNAAMPLHRMPLQGISPRTDGAYGSYVRGLLSDPPTLMNSIQILGSAHKDTRDLTEALQLASPLADRGPRQRIGH